MPTRPLFGLTVRVPGTPVYGLMLPFVVQLLEKMPSGAER